MREKRGGVVFGWLSCSTTLKNGCIVVMLRPGLWSGLVLGARCTSAGQGSRCEGLVRLRY